MRAGNYNQSVTLENPTNTPDGDGGFTVTWAAVSPSPVWASVLPATAAVMERAVAGTVQSSISHLVEMRYHSGITTQTRLSWTGNAGQTHTAYVRGVQSVDEAGEVTRLTCEEVVA